MQDLVEKIRDFFQQNGYNIESLSFNIESETVEERFIGQNITRPIIINQVMRISLEAIGPVEAKLFQSKEKEPITILPQKRKFDINLY